MTTVSIVPTKTYYDMSIWLKFLLALTVFFTPIIPAMIAVGVLIIIDTLTGVIAAYKEGGWVNITSKKLGRILTKMLVYQLLIISAHLVEVYLFPVIPFLKITIAFCGLTEFLSIGENFTRSTGKNFIKYIKDIIDTKFRGMIEKEKNPEQ